MKRLLLFGPVILFALALAYSSLSPVSEPELLFGGLVEDFEGYTASASLVGQGSWALDAGNDTSQVVSTPVNGGTRAASMEGGTGNNNQLRKAFSGEADGGTRVYMRAAQTDRNGGIVLKKDSNTCCVTVLHFRNSGFIGLYVHNGVTDLYTTVAASYSADTWYAVDVEWRSSDNFVRARVDEGAWTDWMYNGFQTTWTAVDTFAIQANDSAGLFYYDDISDIPVPAPAVTFATSTIHIDNGTIHINNGALDL